MQIQWPVPSFLQNPIGLNQFATVLHGSEWAIAVMDQQRNGEKLANQPDGDADTTQQEGQAGKNTAVGGQKFTQKTNRADPSNADEDL